MKDETGAAARAKGNLFSGTIGSRDSELITTLLARDGVRVERIVSMGTRSPDGFWYDQPDEEWVVVVSGAARIDFDDGPSVSLVTGDHLVIPARKRHRVGWSHPALPTVWLAVHIASPKAM